MTNQDKIIASLRKQLQEANSKISALEQEVELLKYENIDREKILEIESVL